MPTYSLVFFLGSITALLYERWRHNASLIWASNILGFPVLVLLFINLPELRNQYGLVLGDTTFMRTWADPINWIVVYSLFICAVLNSSSLAILNSRFVVYLGGISYGFYLIHYPVLMFFVKVVDVGPLTKFILAFSLSVLVSQISLRYFERPVGRIIRSVGIYRSKNTIA